MRILLSNDDGIQSKGILALKSVLEKEHEIYLIAPSREKSATSQALTILSRMLVEKHDDRTYSVNGFPTDCVNIGLFGEIFPNVDMVISGINRGVNMGHDVHYSGTVGAARHGAVHGLYSIAVSSGNRTENYDYIKEAEFISRFINNKLNKLQKSIVYNINFPLEYSNQIEEIEIVNLGKRTYSDKYHISHFKEKRFHYLLALTDLGYKEELGTDFEAFYRGKVTLTPITLDTTHPEEIQSMKKIFFL